MKTGDTAYCTQGSLPNFNNYTQGITMEPPTVKKLMEWWYYNAHYRQVYDLQDRLLGLEERLGVKETLLEAYRESTSSLGTLVF